MIDLAQVMTSLTEEIAFGDGDPSAVIDRYYTPDIVQYVDGRRLEHTALVDHVRPARKNLVSFRYDVSEALVTGDRIAARYTLHAVMRKGRTLDTDVYMFGELAGDGRFRRQHMLTRSVTGREEAPTTRDPAGSTGERVT